MLRIVRTAHFITQFACRPVACSRRCLSRFEASLSARVPQFRFDHPTCRVTGKACDKFRNPHSGGAPQKIELIRSTEEEKQSQLKRLRDFKARHKDESGPILARLQQAVIDNQNVFEVLVDAVRCCSLGQITNALFEVGGQYRRNM